MEDDELTGDEKRIEESDDVTGEEAHRIGEFDDLRDRLENIAGRLDSIENAIGDGFGAIRETLDSVAAMAVENGAVVREASDGRADGSIDAVVIDGSFDSVTPLDDIDLEM